MSMIATFQSKSLRSVVTGSGKSTFIKMASGMDVNVGHDLKSCKSLETMTIRISELTMSRYTVPRAFYLSTQRRFHHSGRHPRLQRYGFE